MTDYGPVDYPFRNHIPPAGYIETPEPHLPLRKASALKLRNRGPQPLFVRGQHGAQGFKPAVTTAYASAISSAQPVVAKSPVTAYHDPAPTESRMSSLDAQSPVEQQSTSSTPRASTDRARSKTTTSEPTFKRLKSSRSVSDGLRHLRERLSRHNVRDPPSHDSKAPPLPTAENTDPDAPTGRTSSRSAWTSTSSMPSTSTERSSLIKEASASETNKIRASRTYELQQDEADFSVDDAIGMYADGFGTPPSSESNLAAMTISPRPSTAVSPRRPDRSHAHKRSLSAGTLSIPAVPRLNQALVRSSTQIISGAHLSIASHDPFPPVLSAATLIPRDRYGFKKVSPHVTLAQYLAWETLYEPHLVRRRRKWEILMKSNGLSTEPPSRFPPISEKLIRYVRKGIPPEWRGAAWFWYAGGPGLLKKNEGVYYSILNRIKHSDALSSNDREHIERDLDRTFPDNVLYKPDSASLDAGRDVTTMEMPAMGLSGLRNNQQDAAQSETSIMRALRRLLQAFAVHSPEIGYCQSLNFIAGLLLLLLDQDEEKAFVLLNVVTTEYLPGTHGVSLEGTNVDISVLMASIKDVLPGIWSKLDDKPRPSQPGAPAPLPTVSLATTAWFMSLFVGTLPMESVLRVWDCLFVEGSKTLFRVALTIFKLCEEQIKTVGDSMEVFQIVQATPRGMLDVNAMMDTCFRRRTGFLSITQEWVESKRRERRQEVRQGRRTTELVASERNSAKASSASGGGVLAASKSLRGRLRAKTRVS